MFDLSGNNAATSSIFLNCHGNRDGYRNGRMSKPAEKKKGLRCDADDAKGRNQSLRLSSGLYPSYVQHKIVRTKKKTV